MGWDLVTVWTLVIGFALMMYVLLDGLDLGVSVLFLGVSKKRERDVMVASVPKGWDGNELWLVLVAVGLLAAFPLAYSVLLQALAVPLVIILCALLLRGLAWHFRSKAALQDRARWDVLICVGAVLATFFQGMVMGAVVEGFTVENQQYIGGLWDWVSLFSLFSGVSLLFAYALLGATWLIIQTEASLRLKMRAYSRHLLVWLGYAMCVFVLFTPFLTEALRERWLGLPNFFYMGFIPMLSLMQFTWVYYVIRFSEWQRWPFALTQGLLVLAYLTLITSLWPNVLPPNISAYDIVASEAQLQSALWGVLGVMPCLVGYTVWIYRAHFSKVQRTQMAY